MTNSVRQFLACYFHQGWNDEYENYTDAIIDYCRGATTKDLKVVDVFVDQVLADEDLSGCDIRQYGGFYIPEVDGISKKEFLTAIKDNIRRKLSTTYFISSMQVVS